MNNKKIILILIALAIAGGLLFYWFFSKTSPTVLPSLNSNTLPEPSPATNTPEIKIVQDGQIRPSEQFDRCVGTIEEISDNTIKIKAEKDRNPFGQEMSFQITITPETKIWPSDNDAIVNSDNQTVFLINSNIKSSSVDTSKPPATLKLNDLQIGQSILVMGVEKFQSNNISAKFLYLLPPK